MTISSTSSASPWRAGFDVCGILLLVCGESLGGLMPRPLAVGPFSVWLLLGAAIVAVRHVIWRSPALPTLVGRWVRGPGRGKVPSSSIVALLLATRIVVLIAGALAVYSRGLAHTQPPPRLVSHNVILNLPARFDAGWYLRIARHGYEWQPYLRGKQNALAFFPLHPLAMHIGGDVVTLPAKVLRDPDFLENGDTRVLWGGVLVAVLCFLAGARAMYQLGIEFGIDAGRTSAAIVLLATYPFALFYSAPYSEGLFLLCSTATVLAWMQGRSLATLSWGLLTGLARSNGWTLAVALMADAVLVRRDRHPGWYLAALGPVLGAAMYSAYVYALTGHPLDWAIAQQAWDPSASPLRFVVRRWDALLRNGVGGYLLADPVDALTFAATLLALAAAFSHLWRRAYLQGTWILAYLLPALALDLPATGRLTAVLVPMFFWLAPRARGAAFIALAGAFTIGEVFLASLFFRSFPPY